MFIRGIGSSPRCRGNVFERNDASYAWNNCFEVQQPGNIYRHNRANHGSHGIWVGGSNDTVLEDNEACYNGLPSGNHNAPWTFVHVPKGPQAGAAGIIFAGFSTHTICRGNKCIGNNGGGLCMFVDPAPTPAYKTHHWVLENNIVRDNRWGIYVECADWIDMTGNVVENNRDGNLLKRAVPRTSPSTPTIPGSLLRPAPCWPGRPQASRGRTSCSTPREAAIRAATSSPSAGTLVMEPSSPSPAWPTLSRPPASTGSA